MHDEQTSALIAQARTLNGVPAERLRLPFRNIRDVLALHAKTAGHKPYLIHYDADGTRHELSYVEFVARVHQVANLLYDDLKLQRGDTVAIMGHNHPDVVLIYFACWVVGIIVAPQNMSEDDARIAYILRNCSAKVVFALGDYVERAERILSGGDGTDGNLGVPNVLGMIQVDGAPQERYLHFREIVMRRPTTF